VLWKTTIYPDEKGFLNLMMKPLIRQKGKKKKKEGAEAENPSFSAASSDRA